MELKRFVSSSLQQIFEGIAEAQKSVPDGGKICPVIKRQTGIDSTPMSTDGIPVEFFEFDVAVSVDESSGKDGSISIAFGALKLGGSGNTATGNETVSRIKFRVPVQFPKA